MKEITEAEWIKQQEERIKKNGFICIHKPKEFTFCLPQNVTIVLCRDCFKDLAVQVQSELIKETLNNRGERVNGK